MVSLSPNLGWHAYTRNSYLQLEVSLGLGRYRCDYIDLRSMSLDVKVLFGNLSLVSAPAFHLEPKSSDGGLFTRLPCQHF